MNPELIKDIRDAINSMDLGVVCILGILDTGESLCINALPGGRTVQVFQDGTADKELLFEIGGKTQDNPRAYKMLNTIALGLEALETLPSNSELYDFHGIEVVSEASFVQEVDGDYSLYGLTIKVNITTYKEEKDNA